MILRFGIILLYLSHLMVQAVPPIHHVRQQFLESVDDENKTKQLYRELKPENIKNSPLHLGYFGATQALLAKHSWNPYNKLDFLNKAMGTLSTAISQSPENLELRFLRFSIQHYIPAFLGQSKNLAEDRDAMLQQIKIKNYLPEDMSLVKNVIGFMLETKRCTPEQQIFLRSYL